MEVKLPVRTLGSFLEASPVGLRKLGERGVETETEDAEDSLLSLSAEELAVLPERALDE